MKGSAVAMAELSLRGSLEKQHGAESTQDLESGGLKRKGYWQWEHQVYRSWVPKPQGQMRRVLE